MNLTVKAIRINCRTGEEKIVDLEIYDHYHTGMLNSWWLHVKNGVTGYESREISSMQGKILSDWHACAGTKGRWDTLIIKQAEMKKISEAIDKEYPKDPPIATSRQ